MLRRERVLGALSALGRRGAPGVGGAPGGGSAPGECGAPEGEAAAPGEGRAPAEDNAPEGEAAAPASGATEPVDPATAAAGDASAATCEPGVPSGEGGPPAGPASVPAAQAATAPAGRVGRAPPGTGWAVAEILKAAWVDTDLGPVLVKEAAWALDHRHGSVRVGATVDADPGALRLALGDARAPHPSRLAFLDLETTGLAGGTGTIAFLACVGSFDEDAFSIRQYFLAGLGGERAMLSLLARDLSRFDGLVTYNGRAFDVPIIQARMVLSRLPDPCARLPHFDVLHAVRRLYRHRLPSCRLAEAEGHLLGVRRVDDVPGHLIPSLYFDYIRAGRVAPLRGVFRHNADDVLSMAGIVGAVADLFSRPDPDPRDALSLARWWEIARDPGRAEALYRRALEGLDAGPVAQPAGRASSRPRPDPRADAAATDEWRMAARRYAWLRKRAGARRDVVDIWRRLWLEGDREAGVEVAKYLEHEARDLRGAADVAGAMLETATEGDRAELEHRLARIRRKIEAAVLGRRPEEVPERPEGGP